MAWEGLEIFAVTLRLSYDGLKLTVFYSKKRQTLLVLTRFYTQNQGITSKMDAIMRKENRFSFQKIYLKSQISFPVFEKIAIEVERFSKEKIRK